MDMGLGEELPEEQTPRRSQGHPRAQGGQASRTRPQPISIPSFQMYQKEEQVLEELGRRMGLRLQPLSRGLF